MVQDVERDEVEFISKTLGCTPVAHPDSLAADKLGTAGLVEDISVSGDHIEFFHRAHPSDTTHPEAVQVTSWSRSPV